MFNRSSSSCIFSDSLLFSNSHVRTVNRHPRRGVSPEVHWSGRPQVSRVISFDLGSLVLNGRVLRKHERNAWVRVFRGFRYQWITATMSSSTSQLSPLLKLNISLLPPLDKSKPFERIFWGCERYRKTGDDPSKLVFFDNTLDESVLVSCSKGKQTPAEPSLFSSSVSEPCQEAYFDRSPFSELVGFDGYDYDNHWDNPPYQTAYRWFVQDSLLDKSVKK